MVGVQVGVLAGEFVGCGKKFVVGKKPLALFNSHRKVLVHAISLVLSTLNPRNRIGQIVEDLGWGGGDIYGGLHMSWFGDTGEHIAD